ncbi:cyclic nucleotide-binding domain-containing protein [Devosia sp.]|uniref:cyclic nucleotide-binding domain-containing protein n=1 Tax=Devosia sp. TaxID=1871048 RepID=UPI003A8E5DFA
MLDHFWLEAIGYCGTAATVVSYSMRTIIPLRIAGIVSSFFFIIYATAMQSWPMLVTELIILPLNIRRLYQIMKLLRQMREAPDGADLTDWLNPFASQRTFVAGQTIFRLGDSADHMLLLHSGRYRLVERDIELGPGDLVGEIGFVSPERRRTMTLECVEGGQAGRISYDDLRQLFFQNPRFGYYLLHLLGRRLVTKLDEDRAPAANPSAT